MRVYNIRDRSTGKLIRKKHWDALGWVKAHITSDLKTNNPFYTKKYENGNLELVIFELVEKQTIPLTTRNDFNQAMYHTIEPEEKKK